MRAPTPPPFMLAAVSAFRRRASAHLLHSPGPGAMSLANLSGIEPRSGKRQGWPFGLSFRAVPGPLDQIDRLPACCDAPTSRAAVASANSRAEKKDGGSP